MTAVARSDARGRVYAAEVDGRAHPLGAGTGGRLRISSRCLPTLLVAAGVACPGRDRVGSAPLVNATFAVNSDTSAFAYFPAASLDSFRVTWFGGVLRAMHEPSLVGATIPRGATLLRFLWLRSFHPPVTVRILSGSGRCTSTTAVLAGPRPEPPSTATGVQPFSLPGPGSIQRRDSNEVSQGECAALTAQLAAAGFWTAPTEDGSAGLDGAEWIFEGVNPAGYHVVTRWSPDSTRSPAFWRIGQFVLKLGRAVPAKNEIY
jgi:hypothetical protein